MPTSSSDHSKTWTRSAVLCTATAVVGFVVYFVMPSDMNELARRTAAIFIIAAIMWATEALPLFATSFVIIALQILFLADQGGLAAWLPAISAFPQGEADPGKVLSLSYNEFLKPFSSGIIIKKLLKPLSPP